MRYRLSQGQRSGRYLPGQFVSAAYAARYPHKVEPDEREEWEISLSLRTRPKGERGRMRVEDITVRMVARVTGRHTRDEVKAAFWYAHKHGAAALTDWRVAAIDWREYEYPTATVGVDEVLDNAGGIVNTVGMDKLRVDRVEV